MFFPDDNLTNTSGNIGQHWGCRTWLSSVSAD